MGDLSSELKYNSTSQIPHHNGGAWKRHWDDHPELPDKIYIAARKKASAEDEEAPAIVCGTDTDTSTLTPIPSSDYEYRAATPHISCSSSPSESPDAVVSKSTMSNHQRVTKDDLRAMATYMVEKRHEWRQYRSHRHCWEEFSLREEVGYFVNCLCRELIMYLIQNLTRRSHDGWCRAAALHAPGEY